MARPLIVKNDLKCQNLSLNKRFSDVCFLFKRSLGKVYFREVRSFFAKTVFVIMTTVFVIGGSRHPGAMESVFITVRRSPWKRDTGIFENTLGFFCILYSSSCFPVYSILREFSFDGMLGIPVKRLTNSRFFIF